MKKRTGARGLRAILEQTMLDVMYDVPANDKACKIVVTKASIEGKESPKVVEGERKKRESAGSTLKTKSDIESAS